MIQNEETNSIVQTTGGPAGWGRLADTFRSLRHRNYRLYFFGQLVSLTGSWVQITALMWLTYEQTHESLWTSLVSVSQILPTFLLGPWGGSLADFWPKKSLLLVTQGALLFLALVLAGLVFSGSVALWQILVITTAGGLIQAVDFPARLAFVMDMVGREDLINAVALNSLFFNVARALGPALAGWLLTIWGPQTCFLLNGLSYVAVLWALKRMDSIGIPQVSGMGKGSLWDGFRYLADRPALGLLILLAGIMGFCGWPSQSLLPALAQRTLAENADGYSWMVSGTGFGALAGALTVAAFGSMARRQQFLGAGVGLISAALIGLSAVPNLPLAILTCAGLGFGLILFLATGQSIVQLSAGEHNRGRIMGIWAMVLSGAVPFGNLLFGPLADHWGETVVLRIEGMAAISAALVVSLLLRSGRRQLGNS